jgi:hypothetical protein
MAWKDPTPNIAMTMGNQTRGPRLPTAQSRKKASSARIMIPVMKKRLFIG